MYFSFSQLELFLFAGCMNLDLADIEDDPDDDPEYRVPADAETGILTYLLDFFFLLEC